MYARITGHLRPIGGWLVAVPPWLIGGQLDRLVVAIDSAVAEAERRRHYPQNVAWGRAFTAEEEAILASPDHEAFLDWMEEEEARMVALEQALDRAQDTTASGQPHKALETYE